MPLLDAGTNEFGRHGEPVVTKHRVSAFIGTDLEMILKANGIETLVLAGVKDERSRAVHDPPS
jgi:nicotinamidase-related amidase